MTTQFSSTYSVLYSNVYTTLVGTILAVAIIYLITQQLMKSEKEYLVVTVIKNILFFGAIYYCLYFFFTIMLEATSFSIFQPQELVMPFKTEIRVAVSVFASCLYMIISGINPLGVLRNMGVMALMFIGMPVGFLFIADNFSFPAIDNGSPSSDLTLNGTERQIIPNYRGSQYYRLMQSTAAGAGGGLAMGIGLIIVSIKVGRFAPLRNTFKIPATTTIGAYTGWHFEIRKIVEEAENATIKRTQDINDQSRLLSLFRKERNMNDMHLTKLVNDRFDKTEAIMAKRDLKIQQEVERQVELKLNSILASKGLQTPPKDSSILDSIVQSSS